MHDESKKKVLSASRYDNGMDHFTGTEMNNPGNPVIPVTPEIDFIADEIFRQTGVVTDPGINMPRTDVDFLSEIRKLSGDRKEKPSEEVSKSALTAITNSFIRHFGNQRLQIDENNCDDIFLELLRDTKIHSHTPYLRRLFAMHLYRIHMYFNEQKGFDSKSLTYINKINNILFLTLSFGLKLPDNLKITFNDLKEKPDEDIHDREPVSKTLINFELLESPENVSELTNLEKKKIAELHDRLRKLQSKMLESLMIAVSEMEIMQQGTQNGNFMGDFVLFCRDMKKRMTDDMVAIKEKAEDIYAGIKIRAPKDMQKINKYFAHLLNPWDEIFIPQLVHFAKIAFGEKPKPSKEKRCYFPKGFNETISYYLQRSQKF